MIEIFSAKGPALIEKTAFMDAVNAVTDRKIAPFAPTAHELLKRLSARLLTRQEAPQLTALGYWLRPAAIRRQQQAFETAMTRGHLATPRGMAFHLPPTNVDTLFVYSWALSLLAGNSNVVRLPSNRAPLTQWLIKALLEALEEAEDYERHIFCAYDHGTDLGRDISALSDLRMVWGGDAKVREVSADPVRPDGLSLGFPDRKSLAAINARTYATADTSARDKLAAQFFNDVYWFDQMGCGSPRVMIWVGSEEAIADLPRDFYTRVADVTRSKGYAVETGVAISKFSYLNDMLAKGAGISGYRLDNTLSVLELDPEKPVMPARVIGGGMISNLRLDRLEDATGLMNRATQTITHFGFDEARLHRLAKAMRGRGGFRIVPIGQALSFDVTWDGVGLLECMTRRIAITP